MRAEETQDDQQRIERIVEVARGDQAVARKIQELVRSQEEMRQMLREMGKEDLADDPSVGGLPAGSLGILDEVARRVARPGESPSAYNIVLLHNLQDIARAMR